MSDSSEGALTNERLLSPPSPTTQWEKSHGSSVQLATVAGSAVADPDPGSMHDRWR